MLDIAEALDLMVDAFAPLGTERLTLLGARGRFAAEELNARFDSPPFDNSAMDGYAVRANDVTSIPTRLRVAGESRAGGPLPGPLSLGTACRIFTGAPMPSGADTVVMQEDTTAQDGVVEVRADVKPRQHVRHRGSDLAEGGLLITRGSRIGPGEIGLLASQNYETVEVFSRPRVAILSTGDELRELGTPPEPGMIYNSNAYALAAQVEELGAEPVRFPIVGDDIGSLIEALREAASYDVVITTGGVSVGEYDFMHEAFKAVGVEIDFWKVAIKPGKPFLFARAGAVPVIGLPGNPVSAMVTFEVLVAPGLRQMLGDPEPHPQTFEVKLTSAYRRRAGRVEIARARVHKDDGQWWADLASRQGSGSLPSVADVNAWVIFPADCAEVQAGDALQALRWGPGWKQARSPFAGP